MSTPDSAVGSDLNIAPTPAERVMKQTSKTAAEMEDQSDVPFPFPTADNHDAPPHIEQPVIQDTSEDALDAGIEESFPASDPVSVTVTKVVPIAPANSKP